MSVHPIEFRYFYPEMKGVFTEEAKLQKWLDVEAALAWAHAQLGSIPVEAAEEIGRKADVGVVKLERMKDAFSNEATNLLLKMGAKKVRVDEDDVRWTVTLVESYNTSIKKEILLDKGVPMKTIEAATVKTPKTYIQVTGKREE